MKKYLQDWFFVVRLLVGGAFLVIAFLWIMYSTYAVIWDEIKSNFHFVKGLIFG